MNYALDALWWRLTDPDVRALASLLTAPPLWHSGCELPVRELLGEHGFRFLLELDEHPQALHAVHAQLRINHVHVGIAHAATADRMVNRVSMFADHLLYLCIGLRACRGIKLAPAKLRQRGLRQNVAHQFEAANQAVHVVAVAQKVGVYQGQRHRVFAGQRDTAPA